MLHRFTVGITASVKKKKQTKKTFIGVSFILQKWENACDTRSVSGLIIKMRNWIPVNYHHRHVLKEKWSEDKSGEE